MKTRWTFMFEYEDFSFERILHYEASIPKEMCEKVGLPKVDLTATITIDGTNNEHGKVKQRGKIHITIPGYGETTKDLAYGLVASVSEQITFSQGKISVIGSFVSNELLPETPVEKDEVGENRFGVFMQIKEVPERRPFNPRLGTLKPHPLLKQFNESRAASSPVDRFIGLFKILEDLYGPKAKQGVATAFKKSTELEQLALQHLEFVTAGDARPMERDDFEELMDKLVAVRHECAHLRSEKNFGIRHGDPRVKEVVEPLLNPLQVLAEAAVAKHTGIDRQPNQG